MNEAAREKLRDLDAQEDALRKGLRGCGDPGAFSIMRAIDHIREERELIQKGTAEKVQAAV